ncbi:MAG TPA: polysaccharide biosynthesis tyrosine autokinase [Vicinamibacterales bacterium]|jgi:capsular exopolysaccharide synthesis family protein
MFDTPEMPTPRGDLTATQLQTASGSSTSSIHVLDRLNAVFKHRRLASTAFLIVVALMMIQTYSTTPIYQTESRIQIDDEKTTNLSNLNNLDLYWQDAAEYKKTQFQILHSRALSERVVKKMGLMGENAAAALPPKPHDPISLMRDARVGFSTWLRGLFSGRGAAPADPKPASNADDARLDDVVNVFLGGIQIKPDPDTRLVYIQYTHYDPQFAAHAANTIASEYMEMNLEHRLENIDKMIKWVNGEVDKQGALLEQGDLALANYRGSHDALSLSRQDLMGQRLSTIQAQLSQAQATRQQKQTLYDQVKSADPGDDNADAFPSVGANGAVVDAKAAYRISQGRLQDLQRQGFGEGYAPLAAAKTEVANAHDKLVAARRTVIEAIKQEYQGAAIGERQAQAALEQAKGEQAGLDLKAVDYNKLQREDDGIRSVYNSLLQQQKELSVVSNSRQNNVSLIEHAQVPTVPIAPLPRRAWISAILMGVVIAFGLAFGIEYLDDTVKTPDDITRRLRIPLLGLVPAIRGERVPLLTEPVPHDFGEAFRSLRTSLVFTSAAEHTRIIAITSSQPLEGKTTTTANLALALALGGARVLVLDADMRRPGLHKSLGVPNEIGLSHLLQGQARVRDAVQRTAEPNLLMISAGRTPTNPSELLGSERMNNFLINLERGPFDWVIIDTPPVLAVTDAVILTPKLSGVVFVIGSEMTRLVHAERALDTIRASRPRTLSAVLNRVDFDRNKYYYSRYYGYQYKSYYGQSTQGAA